eukprot:g26916.t1
MISMFADDTKIRGVVDSKGGCIRVQQGFDQMGQWAKEWQKEFNLNKCVVLHFGKTNQGRTYTFNGKVLGRVAEQRDLRVQVHWSLKVKSQVDRIVKAVFGMLAFI